MAFVFLSGVVSGKCGCKCKLLEWLWLCVACAAIASACVRVDVLRGGLPRGAWACEVPAGARQLCGHQVRLQLMYQVYEQKKRLTQT